MARIRPFAGIRYSNERAAVLSDLIAPPYDVLDEKSKAALLAKNADNIVAIDLPHLPAKTVGPESAYQNARALWDAAFNNGVFAQDRRSAFYAYTQSYTHGGRTFHRRGFFALVRLSPFGQGEVYPHEQTYPQAIVDRLKLTTATAVQLSPVFGLFSDMDNKVTSRLFHDLGKPDMTGTFNGVENDLWVVSDSETENAVIDLMGKKPIYIADGHHRYTMALQYQKDQAALHGGALPPNHPANYVMFVLVAMQDDGLLILPTHRIIGGMSAFDPQRLAAALGTAGTLREIAASPDAVAHYADTTLATKPLHTFGLYDGATRKLYELTLNAPDVLANIEPTKSAAWRSLDVAILQRYLLDTIINPTFAPGKTLSKAYTAYGHEVVPMTDGVQRQIAMLLRPTPLKALEDLAQHGEVMPQKSTFFFPKLATGLVFYPLMVGR